MNKETYRDTVWKENEEAKNVAFSFWDTYMSPTHWEFWWIIGLLVIPLIVLFFKVDKNRLFEVFFFGYTMNMLWGCADTYLFKTSQIIHYYFLTPYLPFAFNVTASLLPVGFLLLYQHCENHQRNFYFWSIGLSAVFAFGFGSLEQVFQLIDTNKGLNPFYLFAIDVVVAFISYWITKGLMKWTKKNLHVEKT